MKVITMFCRDTKDEKDAKELYDRIVEAVKEDAYLTVEFRENICWQFAKEIMEFILTSHDYKEIQKHVKFKGFKALDQASWNNMTSAKINAEYTARGDNVYGYHGYAYDGW